MSGLLDPHGRPLDSGPPPKVEVRDAAITYTTRAGQSYSADARTLLMAMARRKRDGASDRAIFDEFDIRPGRLNVTWETYNAALRTGMLMLAEAIAAGEEPAETLNEVEVEDDE